MAQAALRCGIHLQLAPGAAAVIAGRAIDGLLDAVHFQYFGEFAAHPATVVVEGG
jgi:hypothetical protein